MNYGSGVPNIVDLEFFPMDVELLEPFGIATGAQLVARNVVVRLTLADGTQGIGEAAPFPAVNGETQEQVLAALPAARRAVLGSAAARYRRVAAALREALPATPSAQAAVEIALFDALTRRARCSLSDFFGGQAQALRTDITLPTGDVDQAARAARRAAEQGFDTLKVKVGGALQALDAERIRNAAREAPQAAWILDANASLSADAALGLLDALGSLRERVVLFEQPTPREDWDGLRRVQEHGRVPVAADESARNSADVAELSRHRVVSVINIKITKCGVVEAWDMAVTSKTCGLGLMIGGMVETELAMTASACLAAGLGGFQFVDLDTPLFMAERPKLRGGFLQRGPELDLAQIEAGHGVTWLG